MHPRHLTGQAGNLLAGSCLALRPAAALLFIRALIAAVLLLSAAVPAFSATNVIELTYDAAGNIVGLKRQTNGAFAITSFSPTSGPVCTAVTIYRSGFSATPAN